MRHIIGGGAEGRKPHMLLIFTQQIICDVPSLETLRVTIEVKIKSEEGFIALYSLLLCRVSTCLAARGITPWRLRHR